MSCYRDEIAPSIELTAGVDSARAVRPDRAGPARIPWEDAAETFCEEMAPLVARAKELDVRLAVEPTNPLRSDVSFVHTVRDAVDLARMAGIGVVRRLLLRRGTSAVSTRSCARTSTSWRSCRSATTSSARSTCRTACAVGDGDIPVERLVAMVLDAGYEGAFELEILGPQIEEEGYRAPIIRSLERTSEMLDRLGG